MRPYLLMGVTYELLDVPYPFVSAIYTCPCGRHAVRHATQAGMPPPEWEERQEGQHRERYICPDCAQRLPAPERAEG